MDGYFVMPPPMLALSIKHLQKTYKSGTVAVRDVSLDVEAGDFFALLGANGAGKTTIIGIITGLVNKTGGTVEVFGHSIDTDFAGAKTCVGVVPQEFNLSIFERVIDIVVNQAGYYGIPRSVAVPRATEILTIVGLGDKLTAKAGALSGGMKRRLMIARALIHEPRLLILDEPTAGVDVELRIGMWDYLRRLNTEKGVTIILTTHYLEEVEQLCRNMAMIKRGEIVRRDSVKNIVLSLSAETYTLETAGGACPSLPDMAIRAVDETTLEATIDRSRTVSDLIAHLSEHHIRVLSMRPKGSRLEELFMER